MRRVIPQVIPASRCPAIRASRRLQAIPGPARERRSLRQAISPRIRRRHPPAAHRPPISRPLHRLPPATPVNESSQSSATANQTLPSGSGSSADGQGTAASDPPPTAPLPSTDSGVPQGTPGEPNTTSQVPSEPNTTTQVPAESNTATQVPSESNTTTQVPAESNTTTQVILQIQLAGCTIHCNGTSQTQVASQLNTTVQAIGDLTPISANSTPQTGADDGEAAISIPGRWRGRVESRRSRRRGLASSADYVEHFPDAARMLAVLLWKHHREHARPAAQRR